MGSATATYDDVLPADGLQADLATLYGQWVSLAALLEKSAPNVIVLIARKTPRLFEAFGLNVLGNPLVISDHAIAVSERYLAGAHVAVVDDVINVGSTVWRTMKLVEEAGARKVEAFAISKLDRSCVKHEFDGFWNTIGDRLMYADSGELDRPGLMRFAARVPEALQVLAKPYDMDFPIMECRLQMPFRTYQELYFALASRYGDDNVYDLSTPRGHASRTRRLAIDMPNGDGQHHDKVRVYFDEATAQCNVVPIRIAQRLDDNAPAIDPWSRAVWSVVSSEIERAREAATSPVLERARRDALARLRLFSDSLEVGNEFLRCNRDLVALSNDEPPFSTDEAQLTFGPMIRRVTREYREPRNERLTAYGQPTPSSESRCPSPFLDAATQHGLIARILEASPSTDTLTLFTTTFEVLADAVGVHSPSSYSLNWPYSQDQILSDPYLRLRIGPTLPDLVAILSRAQAPASPEEPPSHDDELYSEVVRLVDRFIDYGSVVPTTAEYDGHIYRIYRKGERRPRVTPADRLLNAWQNYEEPLSLTRVTKLATILAFSSPSDSAVVVKAQERGNTLCFASSVLHDETEVAQYLRNTKQIEPV